MEKKKEMVISNCIREEKGCVCGGCPVYVEMNLENEYYCIKGSEKEYKMAK